MKPSPHREHLTIQLKNKIQEISNDFLTQHGFSYFQYLRCYYDGSASLLTNDTSLFEYTINKPPEKLLVSSFNKEHQNLHSYWFLWDEGIAHTPAWEIIREKFNIYHGITLVRRFKNYYDLIAFGLPEFYANSGTFYLNKLKAIEYFINNFDKNHRDLINLINQSPIMLPEYYRDDNYQKLCLTNNKIEIQTDKGLTYITPQEVACLRLLLQGASHKQIASILNISPRTVETYIARIKQRSGLSSSKELENLISVCP